VNGPSYLAICHFASAPENGRNPFPEVYSVAIPNPLKELGGRLSLKSLDSQFSAELQHGLNCSPFEASCVVQLFKEIYAPFLAESAVKAPPGRITLVCVADDEPAGKPLVDCRKVSVSLALHRGDCDDQLLLHQGPTAFRRARIPDLCQEALSQDGLLTREDLAFHVFFVSPRTISRDLAALRQQKVPVPLRSLKHDIGPVLTHRTEIVQLALQGKTTAEICQIMKHSPEAVANYLSTFIRCAQLQEQRLEVGQIAYLLRRGPALIRQYLALLERCQTDKNMAYHLAKLLTLGRCLGAEKKSAAARRHHG
jgi:hypothetical protein